MHRLALPCPCEKTALSFDDILMVPQHSNVPSRSLPDVSTHLTRKISIKHPVIATNMSTVTEWQMLRTMHESGSFGILHRFMDTRAYEEQISHIDFPFAISVGVKGEETGNGWLDKEHVAVVVVDIAHGDSDAVFKTIQQIKTSYPHLEVIGGNVATREAFGRMVDAGADAVRVGIGGGAACTTRKITGFGLPTLTSIIECAAISKESGVPLIADGGFKDSGDIVKALAFGASAACVGSMLAGTSDTPGAILELPDGKFKEYYGMSSKTAQERHKNGKRRGIAAEGIDKLLSYKGSTAEVLEDIIGGVQSGLAYNGAMNIDELRRRSQYVVLSPGSMRESKFSS